MLHTDIPHESPVDSVHLGTAGWTIRREHASMFAGEGTHLERYASLFNSVEINSCFKRSHRRVTYERWAATVPDHFRFAVKLPRVITHKSKLVDVVPDLDRFLGEVAGLGTKLGPVLVQLPPSFAFDAAVAASFFTDLRRRFDGEVAFEPRHESWFTDPVDAMLVDYRVARIAADPALVSAAAEPGGYDQLLYIRLHGSPRMYYSAYSAESLENVARVVEQRASSAISTWCIFDNTTLGAATTDALAVKSRLLENQRVSR